MKSRSHLVLVAGAALAMGVIAWVHAGQLDPPAGPVQPTMRTLDDVYNLVAQGGGGGGSASWSHRHIPLGTSGATQIATGAGVLHGVLVYPCDCGNIVTLYDSPTTDVTGRPILCELVNGSISATSRFFELDIEFTSGLVYRVAGTGTRGRDTVVYRSN